MYRNLLMLTLLIFTSHGYAQSASDVEEGSCCNPMMEKVNPIEANIDFEKIVTIGAQARFRYEVRDNQDYNDSRNDQYELMQSRIRLNLGINASESLTAFIQPQFSRTWGQASSEMDASGAVSAGVLSSGALFDPAFAMHQAYVHWKIFPNASLKMGRQELAYGDHVVLGDVGWNNVGRSWDAGKVVFNLGLSHQLDLFYATIAEKDTSSGVFGGNADLAGAYAAFSPSRIVDQVDVYGIWLQDKRTGSPASFQFGTMGVRLVYKIRNLDGRLETALQAGKSSGQNMLAYMIDAEEGYTFAVAEGLRLALGYNRASGDDAGDTKYTRYHSMFSTAHKWMGLMDHLGRQNIQTGIIKLKLTLNPKWNFESVLHSFWRIEKTDFIYGPSNNAVIAGQGATPGSTQRHIGEEVDFVANYVFDKHIKLQGFVGVFLPGAYVKNTIGNNWAYFANIQTSFEF